METDAHPTESSKDPYAADGRWIQLALQPDWDLLHELSRDRWMVLIAPYGEPPVVPGGANNSFSVTGVPESRCLRLGLLSIDMVIREACWRQQRLDLTGQELLLLWILAERCNQALPFGELTYAIWQSPEAMYGDALRSAVKRLRKKLRECESTVTIEAVRGFGFRLSASEG